MEISCFFLVNLHDFAQCMISLQICIVFCVFGSQLLFSPLEIEKRFAIIIFIGIPLDVIGSLIDLTYHNVHKWELRQCTIWRACRKAADHNELSPPKEPGSSTWYCGAGIPHGFRQ